MATFEKNVEATIPALRRYARVLTRDCEVADDLVEHTLLQAIRTKHLFHDGDVRDWLYSVLIKLNRDRLRSMERRSALSPHKGDGSSDVTEAGAGSQDIECALSALAEDQRDAWLLVVLEGLSYSEVAEVQGVPLGTVMSRLAHAREVIKNVLEGGR